MRTFALDTGSSPLTRGKLVQAILELVGEGLIPAHAGKILWLDMGLGKTAAHPRSRGENAPPFPPLLRHGGSSPLTRGKCLQARAIDRRPGLIPAHAGKIPGTLLYWGNPAAHPRSRGENAMSNWTAARNAGSSPLTRGKWHPLRPRIYHRGLIPAHAGKMESRRSRTGQTRAHPRSRGENIAAS